MRCGTPVFGFPICNIPSKLAAIYFPCNAPNMPASVNTHTQMNMKKASHTSKTSIIYITHHKENPLMLMMRNKTSFEKMPKPRPRQSKPKRQQNKNKSMLTQTPWKEKNVTKNKFLQLGYMYVCEQE